MKTALFAVVVAAACSSACGGRVSTIDDTPSTTATSSPTATSPTVTPRPPAPPAPTRAPPPPSEQSIYTAHAWPGGYDHMQIFKADFANNQCLELHLVSPSSGGPSAPFSNVLAPAGWSVQAASRGPGASPCNADVNKTSIARDGKGTVEWKEDVKLFPCKLKVHVAVVFDDAPEVETFDADQVSVDGC